MKMLNSLIDFVFKGRTQAKRSINNYRIANCCKCSKYCVFDINSLKKAVEILLEILYPVEMEFKK